MSERIEFIVLYPCGCKYGIDVREESTESCYFILCSGHQSSLDRYRKKFIEKVEVPRRKR